MTLRHLLPALLAATSLTIPAMAQQSGLTAETWTGLTPGKSLLTLQKEGISTRAPNTTQTLAEAKITGLPANSGTRLRGTITPQVDDTYTFWVNGTDNVALWLSEDGTRFTKNLIANHLGSTTPTEWSKHSDQKSIPIALTAGTTYHIEAQVMTSVANGHLSIAWQGRKGNWALKDNGATASQSSTQWDLGASKAIDGQTGSVWTDATLTANQPNSWFKVDFADTRPLNRVVLFNNPSNQNRLSNFRITAMDATGGALAQQDFFTTTGNVGNSFTWDMPAVVQAKSIKIQLLGNNLAVNGHLSLAEVQAYHVTPPPTNWALAANGSTASQSATSNTYLAALAIDGNTNGDLNAGSVTMTEDETNAWLAVDLGQDRAVNRVVLHNRNTLQTRLSNFRVSLLDSSNAVLATRDYFAASGNAGPILYWNLVQSVQARTIRVELLGQNLDGNGHLSLAEVQAFEINPLLEARDFQVIPATYLGAVSPDPADQNGNNLADAWEQQHGLITSSLPGALLEYGDPDKDGMTNYEEQSLGANPLAVESFGEVITRSMWMDLSGNGSEGVVSMTNFANRQRFLGIANDSAQVACIDAATGYRNYGARYRGAFTAPSTGTYHFWLSGSGDAQLWMSDGTVKDPSNQQPLTNRFGKQLLATSGHVTPHRDYDYSSTQRSRSITLVEGQTYYIEVLHKVAQGSFDHVSVAWKPPGQARDIMPATAFLAYQPDAADADDDGLPDAWESANGLNPTNNGRTSAADGEYSDPDADGLSNLFEYQLSTNPFAADTDGDGISDFEEVKFYGSDPKVSNNLVPVAVPLPALSQYTYASGDWSANNNGSLSSSDRGGRITYTFSISEPGVHEVTVAASAHSSTAWTTKSLPISLSIDGGLDPIGTKVLQSANGNPDTVRAITPWLAAGTHTLTIQIDNYDSTVLPRIDSVILKRLGGADLDEDGIPDWIEENAASANMLTRAPTQSRTSPVSIEGITTQLSSTALSLEGVSAPTSIPLTASINNSFFADVPLNADSPVTLNASFQNGIVTSSQSVTWIATNLLDPFTNNTLHIRMGDSLRITAHNPTEAASGTFTLGGATLLSLPSGSIPSTAPHTQTFLTAGTYTLTTTWTPESGPTQSSTVTIVVHSANFGASHLVLVGSPRNWTPTSLGTTHEVVADSRVVFNELDVTGARQFKVASSEAVNRHVVARLPGNIDGAPSAILARGTIQSFDVINVGQTKDASIVTQYPDGSWLMHSTLVAVNLPPNVTVRITAKNQGTLFTNGLTTLDLPSSSFDENGLAQVYFVWKGTGSPTMCHGIQFLLAP